MKKINFLAAGIILFFFSIHGFAQKKNIYEAEGYVQLFNGKDLTGWKIPQGDNGHWSVIDGVIDYDARSEAKGDKNLWTEKEFKDFKLHVEWRFKGYGDHLFPLPTIMPNGEYWRDENGKIIEPLGPNSDSGILLKSSGQANLWCWSVGSGELWSVRNDQSLPPDVRAAAVPKENADRPVGQWNAFDIPDRKQDHHCEQWDHSDRQCVVSRYGRMGAHWFATPWRHQSENRKTDGSLQPGAIPEYLDKGTVRVAVQLQVA